MNIQNIGNGAGWLINENTDQDPQQEKVDKVLYITERVLETLKEVTKIYAKFGDSEAFDVFQNRVNEIMRKASHENYFSDGRFV